MVRKSKKTSFTFKGQKMAISFGKRKRKKRKQKFDSILKTKFTAKLRYVDVISFDPSAATAGKHVFRANGMIDPDVTGTGHQYYGSDELKALYAFYRITSSKIKVTQIVDSTSNVLPGVWGVYRDTDTTLDHNLARNMIESGKRWKLHLGATTSQSNSGNTRSIQSSSFSLRNMSPDERDKSIAVASDPGTGQSDFHYIIWGGGLDGVVNPGKMTFMVELTAVCEFTEPIPLTES